MNNTTPITLDHLCADVETICAKLQENHSYTPAHQFAIDESLDYDICEGLKDVTVVELRAHKDEITKVLAQMLPSSRRALLRTSMLAGGKVDMDRRAFWLEVLTATYA